MASSRVSSETSQFALKSDGEAPLSLQKKLSLNNNENFKQILSLISMEFESQREKFEKFTSEKEFLSSKQLKSFITELKKYIICWAARPECLSWLDGYITSILVGHWRALSDTSPKKTLESFQDHRDVESELRGNRISVTKTTLEPTEDIPTAQITERHRIYPSITLTMEQLNFELICKNLDGSKIVEPHLELAATSCLASCKAHSSQSGNYSWEIFMQKFRQLLEEETPEEAANLYYGTVRYIHPDKKMRIIRNQEQFAVALNHLFCNARGYIISLYYFAPTEEKKAEVFEKVEKAKFDECTAKVACFGDNVVTKSMEENTRKPPKNFDQITSPLHSQIPIPKKNNLKKYSINSPMSTSRLNTKLRNSLIASHNAKGIHRRRYSKIGYKPKFSGLSIEKSDANFNEDMS
ncbi:hypothetical protein GcM1_239026 [Golovinomyces cichoracearum]|uniref:Uncharacterized protein n=1 Tax=Golovinomyces cichoracearum TaxID=62708 RepID=A0A420IIT6_9PEZI|nr:hypothetical protein GcM1_239026 [Golovinomyces cichoracearum]